MVCGACLAIPVAVLGLGLSFTDKYIIGMMLTVFSLCLYLHFYEIKKCTKCIE